MADQRPGRGDEIDIDMNGVTRTFYVAAIDEQEDLFACYDPKTEKLELFTLDENGMAVHCKIVMTPKENSNPTRG